MTSLLFTKLRKAHLKSLSVYVLIFYLRFFSSAHRCSFKMFKTWSIVFFLPHTFHQLSPPLPSYELLNLRTDEAEQIYEPAILYSLLGSLVFFTVPTAPKRQDLLHANHSTVMLKLDHWNDVGCPILRYMIQYKRMTERTWLRTPAELNVRKNAIKY